MKLLYLANARFPTEKAHGLQIAKTIEALTNLGVDVQALLPARNNLIKTSPKKYYRLSTNINIHKLPTIDLFHIKLLGAIPNFIHSFSFIISSILFFRNKKKTSIYTRYWPVASFISLFFPRHTIFLEIHELPETAVGRFLLKVTCIWSKNLISTNPLLTKALHKLTKMTVQTIPNGVDPKDYNQTKDKHSLKNELKMVPSVSNIVYTGSLEIWKGVLTLSQAARSLPDNFHVYIVGGSMKQISKLPKNKNLTYVPHTNKFQVIKYQLAADILVIPNSAKRTFSSKYSSPIKLFEYFFSNNPIVASNVSAIRQFAHNSVLYFKSDNPNDLARKILKLSTNNKLAAQLLSNCRQIRKQYTWNNRAKSIISQIHNQDIL